MSFSGERCEVCVSCGKCAEEWNALLSQGGADAASHATDMASKAKCLDDGTSAPPIAAAPPGVPAEMARDIRAPKTVEADAVTGATPGVSTACKELGLDDMTSVLSARGIKPPGVC